MDPWDEQRDRAASTTGLIRSSHHPPCARWGRYWGGNPTQQPRLKLGDDDGCFAAALDAVREFGGICGCIAEASHAWGWFGLNKPPKSGGWVNSRLQRRLDVLRMEPGTLRTRCPKGNLAARLWLRAAAADLG